MISSLAPYATGFAATILLVWVLRKVAFHIDLVDHPGGRKKHHASVPLIGGLAMFLAFAFSVLMLNAPISELRSFFAGSLLLVVIGVLDDLRELSSVQRFLAQIGAALLMALWGGVVLRDLGAIGPEGTLLGLGVLAVPITVFATVGVINALNMADGVDGLAGGIVLVALGSLVSIAVSADSFSQLPVLVLLLVVVVAFLLFNFRPFGRSLVFMGDAGSMFLGFALAWFLIDFTQGPERVMPPVVALWILGLPLLDTVAMMLRRIAKGRSPFAADREHLHHACLLAGFSPRKTVAFILLIASAFAATGVTAWRMGVSEALLFYAFLTLFGLYFWLIMRAWKVKKFLSHSLHRHEEGPELG